MNNSRILSIKNAKFSGYYFYLNWNVWRNFQICISVPLSNINDDGDNNEKTKNLKTRVGILGGNIPGGNFLGGSFPDTLSAIVTKYRFSGSIFE